VSCARAALYAGFGSPSFGITWSIVTFLSGLAYVIYNDHKRRNNETKSQEAFAELETISQGDARNIDI
jgi:hypothetical protein